MDWDTALHGFSSYMTLEKGLSDHSIEAYERDVKRMAKYMYEDLHIPGPGNVEALHIENFLHILHEVEISPRTQARMLSGIRSFFQYLILEDIIHADPTELIPGPKLDQYLPEVLSYEEILSIISSIDRSHPQGTRNVAIL